MHPASVSSHPPMPVVTYFLHAIDGIAGVLGRDVPPIVQIETLRSQPTGTLGRELVNSLDRDQLDPFTTGPRRKQLHDSIHILAGYGTDPVGEAEVQAFLLGACCHPLHLILSLGLVNIIRRRCPEISLPQLHQRLHRAYQRGWQSSFHPNTWRPEDQWHWPLTQVRSQFGL